MWDKEQRLVISNTRYLEIYGLTPEQARPGVSLREILQIQAANGEKGELDIDQYIESILSQTALTNVRADGRTTEKAEGPCGPPVPTAQPLPQGTRAVPDG